jgi:hypothetical protein
MHSHQLIALHLELVRLPASNQAVLPAARVDLWRIKSKQTAVEAFLLSGTAAHILHFWRFNLKESHKPVTKPQLQLKRLILCTKWLFTKKKRFKM